MENANDTKGFQLILRALDFMWSVKVKQSASKIGQSEQERECRPQFFLCVAEIGEYCRQYLFVAHSIRREKKSRSLQITEKDLHLRRLTRELHRSF